MDQSAGFESLTCGSRSHACPSDRSPSASEGVRRAVDLSWPVQVWDVVRLGFNQPDQYSHVSQPFGSDERRDRMIIVAFPGWEMNSGILKANAGPDESSCRYASLMTSAVKFAHVIDYMLCRAFDQFIIAVPIHRLRPEGYPYRTKVGLGSLSTRASFRDRCTHFVPRRLENEDVIRGPKDPNISTFHICLSHRTSLNSSSRLHSRSVYLHHDNVLHVVFASLRTLDCDREVLRPDVAAC